MHPAPTTPLLATWLHPSYGPEIIDPLAGDNSIWSWALSVQQPHTTAARHAAGWLFDTEAENVFLISFEVGHFALYRLLCECKRDVLEENPNEKAEAVLRALGQDYGPHKRRLCGAYVLISLGSPPLSA